MADKRIFLFAHKNYCDWLGTYDKSKPILGGKGAGLVEMVKAGLPVPPGFTITTTTCNEYLTLPENERDDFIKQLMVEVLNYDELLQVAYGNDYAPLVSVRSGAPVSMPGMMDTILNIGLTTGSFPVWENKLGIRATWDSYRRLIQMLGSTAYNISHNKFEEILNEAKGSKSDTDLTVSDLQAISYHYTELFKNSVGVEFPDSREKQLAAAIRAVFDSWENPRAVEYRKIHNIPDNMGTAVTVQVMVFGNMNEQSGSGVAFTRNPLTGENKLLGEYLSNAQGEDVVAGIRTPVNIHDYITNHTPPWTEEFFALGGILENMYKDMVDFEFTVQDNKLYVLQARVGKRSAEAAFAIAVDLAKQQIIDEKTALGRLTKSQFKILRRPRISDDFKEEPHIRGLAACPGIASGIPVFSSQDAIECEESCILVTEETTPDDIGGMNAAIGILTQTGGATSHAAVVARAMDKVCIVGCTTLDFDALKNAKCVTLDGSTGRVWIDVEVPVIDTSDSELIKTVQEWSLRETGYGLSTPAYVDSMGEQVISVAYWWGQEEVLDAVLSDLCSRPNLGNIILDIRSKRAFFNEADTLLYDCFNFDEGKNFINTIIKQLKTNAKLLKTLAAIYTDLAVTGKEVQALADNGYHVLCSSASSIPKAVNADTAVFAALAA